MPTILEKRQERAELWKKAQALITKADEEKRKMTAEEEQQFDKMMGDIDVMAADIQRREKAEVVSKELEASINKVIKPDPNDPGGEPKEIEYRGLKLGGIRNTPIFRAAFQKYLMMGKTELNSEDLRALQADVDTAGGYIVTPQQFVADLLMGLDNMVSIRKLATVIPLGKAESLGIPTLVTDISDITWTSEIQSVPRDASMAFGKRELHPHLLSKEILISEKLLRVSAVPIESIIQQRLGYKFGVAEENAFMTGSSSQQPLGLFTPSADGISIGRDVLTGAADNFTADGLIDIKYTLKPQYRTNARWILHRTAVAKIRKLKHGDGTFMWTPGIAGGEPDRILELPYIETEYAPYTFSANQYVGILGDLKYYWIADALNISIQRLAELYAKTNQVGYIGRMETDGMPVLEEAFVRIKTSSSG